jgi:hypothetical protein
LTLSCLVAIALGDCGREGWGLFKSCLQPSIQEIKGKMDQVEQCLTDADCELPAAAAPQDTVNASLMIGCFKKHFTILNKVEVCACAKVPTFVMPDFEQMDFGGGDSDKYKAMADRIKAALTTGKCNITRFGLCLRGQFADAGFGGGSMNSNPMCTRAQACVKSSFKDCDVNNTKVVLCECTQDLLTQYSSEIESNATNFHQCIGKPLPDGDMGAQGRKMFRTTVENKVNNMCKVNLDTVCDTPAQNQAPLLAAMKEKFQAMKSQMVAAKSTVIKTVGAVADDRGAKTSNFFGNSYLQIRS